MLSFEVGRAGAFQVQLPAYPGDGSSECMVNDKCYWDVRLDIPNGQVLATWVRTAAESCPTCIKRAVEWNPYTITL